MTTPRKPSLGLPSISKLVEIIEVWLGQRGDPLDRVVTLRDMDDAGYVARAGRYAPYVITPAGEGGDLTSPPTPTGLTVTGAMATMLLEWDASSSTNHAYTEIWRQPSLDAGVGGGDIGLAACIGQCTGTQFSDAVGGAGEFYYWIRFVSRSNVSGPFNAVNGEYGATGQDPAYLIDVLSSAYGVTSDAPFFQLDAPTVIGGVTIPAGTYIKAAFIHDATITTAKIADLAVDNAKIANMSASKIVAGSIDVSEYLQSSNYSAGTAGWRIHGDGSLEANSGTFRGALSAATGTLGTLTIASGGYVQSSNYSAGTAGWKLSQTSAELNGVALNAATGSFAGSLSAATGTLGTLTMGSGGYIKSSNYSAGVSGWKLLETGIEFNTGLTVAYADITGTKPPADADKTVTAIQAGTTVTSGGITFNAGGSIKGGQSDYNTGTGWFLGYSSGAYKFSIGNPAGSNMKWDGTNLILSGQITFTYKSGDNVLLSATTSRSLSTTYDIKKTFVINGNGVVKLQLTLSCAGSGDDKAQVSINVNGVTVTGVDTPATSSPQTHSWDISVNKGDVVDVLGILLNGALSGSISDVYIKISADTMTESYVPLD